MFDFFKRFGAYVLLATAVFADILITWAVFGADPGATQTLERNCLLQYGIRVAGPAGMLAARGIVGLLAIGLLCIASKYHGRQKCETVLKRFSHWIPWMTLGLFLILFLYYGFAKEPLAPPGFLCN